MPARLETNADFNGRPDTYRPLIEHIHDRINANAHWFSLEFFPPKTANAVSNLINRLDRLSQGGPLFADVTCPSAGDPGSKEPTSSLTLASTMLNYCGIETMLHVTCCQLGRDQLRTHLHQAKQSGIKNILALRGDPPPDKEWRAPKNGFNHAADLVRFIREEFGDYFVICVAGYPTGHPDAPTYADDLTYLKQKVDAGADFIITQLFFEASVFLKFVEDCRNLNINIPILPGILPIQTYQSFQHIVRLSKMEVPAEMAAAMTPIKDNEEAVRNYGISHALTMCRELLDSGIVKGLHFYTLNRDVSTVSVLKQLGLWLEDPTRPLPWKVPACHRRYKEGVRPIFWRMRPKSYIRRTSDWVDFPCQRWGDSSKSGFGDMKDYDTFYMKSSVASDKLLKMWGEELQTEQDVWDAFYHYITKEKNKNGVLVTQIPWADDSEIPKAGMSCAEMGEINRRGVLTINSQRSLQAAPSSHPDYGWGDKGGHIYQKAYLEFFTSKDNAIHLKQVLEQYPQVSYHIINHEAEEDWSNCDEHKPNTVTWGIFPNSEVIQPLVVDASAFRSWKDEAFALWRERWGHLYKEGSQSRQVIDSICNSYCLVNLVDNDFPRETCLLEVVQKMLSSKS